MADVTLGAEAFYDEHDISGIGTQFDPSIGGEVKEFAPFNATMVRKAGGLANYGGTLSGVGSYDSAEWQDIWNDTLGAHNLLMPFNIGTLGAAAAEGDLAWLAVGVNGGPQVTAMNGELFEWSLEMNPQPLVLATVLGRGTKTASGNTATGYNLGAIGAGQTGYAYLTVPTATSGTIDVVIESDATNSFSGSETTRFTFTQVTTTATSQLITLSSAVTDTWWRAKWTGASTPSHNIAVAFGILPGN